MKLLQILFIVKLVGQMVYALYTTNWTPCNRECGYGKMYRWKLCVDIDCFPQFQEEQQDCFIQTCNSGISGSAGDCMSNDSQIATLYPSTQFQFYTGCFQPGHYFILETQSRPITIHYIFFDDLFPEKINLKYISLNSMNFMDYPKEKHPELLTPTQVEGYTSRAIKFDPPIEVRSLKVFPVTEGDTRCMQLTIGGCHLAEPSKLFFNQSGIQKFIEPTSENPFIFNTECYTLFRPFYSNIYIGEFITYRMVHMYQYHLPFYVWLSARNEDEYLGKNSITLTINVTDPTELVMYMKCIVNRDEGLTTCIGIFSCFGQFVGQTNNGQFYGNFEKATTEIVLTYDFDECLHGNESCGIGAVCINTNGSFYCECSPPLLGDGYSCYSEDEYLKNLSFVYQTFSYPNLSLPEGFCKGLIYNNVTSEVFICKSVKSMITEPSFRESGCVVSKDQGETWEAIHPRIDAVFGYDITNGDVYGYSSMDNVYTLRKSSGEGHWYSIPPLFYTEIKESGSLNQNKVVVRECTGPVIDMRRRDHFYPLPQAKLNTKDGLFALTSDGVSRPIHGHRHKWQKIFRWNQLPIKELP